MNLKYVLSLGAALLFSGCEISVCKAPVGDTPLDITKETEAWEGFWNLYASAGNVCSIGKGETLPVVVHVRDASNGVLRVHLDYPDDMTKGVEPKLPSFYDVYLRKAGDWILASVDISFLSGTNGPSCFAWGRVKKGKRVAYLWWASKSMLDKLQEEGKAPQYVPKNSDILEAFNSNHVAQVTSGTNGVPFLWDTPWLFIKQD